MDKTRGLFIPENALPREYWEAFHYLAQANGLTPKEFLCKIIVSEVNELKTMREPLLEQAFKKISLLIQKRMNLKDSF